MHDDVCRSILGFKNVPASVPTTARRVLFEQFVFWPANFIFSEIIV